MKDFIINLTTGFGIKDVLDILIVALIVYKVLDFIRETRAQQLVKGIFVLVLAFLISDVLHLYTLNWILRGNYDYRSCSPNHFVPTRTQTWTRVRRPRKVHA